MARRYPLRYLALLALLFLAGILPVRAYFRLGQADNWALVSSSIVLLDDDITVTAPGNGYGPGNVAYTTLTDNGHTLHSPNAPVTPATAQILAADSDYTANEVAFLTNPPGAVLTAGDQSGKTLGPGSYTFLSDIDIAAGGTLTLSGAGDYVFFVEGKVLLNGNAKMVLANGANAANVTWVVTGAVLVGTGADFEGRVLALNFVASQGAVINGKVFAYQPMHLSGPLTINDSGLPPTASFGSVSGPVSGSGTSDDPYVVPEGGQISYQVSSSDPDGGMTMLDHSGDVGASGYSETPALPTAFTTNASTAVSYSPPVGGADGGNELQFTYTATDQSGAVGSVDVYVFVDRAPTLAAPSNVHGLTPINGGTGTAGDPFNVAANGTLTFDLVATDPDMEDPVSLGATGVPAHLTFAPALGTAQNSPATTSVTFSPSGQAGQTSHLVVTPTDSYGTSGMARDIYLHVVPLPAINVGATQTVCVGDTLTFDISVTDTDTSEKPSLSVSNVPVGAAHDPDLNGFDTAGTSGGNLLLQGNPARTRFSWTPIPVDAGSYTVTYTAVDSHGLQVTQDVSVWVSNPPEFNALSNVTGQFGSGAGTQDNPLLIGPLGNLSYTVSADDPDGDLVTISRTGTPAHMTVTGGTNPGTGSATVTQTFTPSFDQSGKTYAVHYQAVDNSPAACPATLTVYVKVLGVPVMTVNPVGPYNLCVGDSITIDVRGSDPTPGGVITTFNRTSQLTGDTFNTVVGAPNNPVDAKLTYTAVASDVGTKTVTVAVISDANISVHPQLTFHISSKPVVAAGAAMIGGVSAPGSGTQNNPYVVGVGETLTYPVSATGDPTDTISVSQSGAPTTLTPNANPIASGTAAATTNETFTPTAAQGGQTFAVTYTAKDTTSAAGCTSNPVTVYIRVSVPPVVTADPAGPFNLCVGDSVTVDVKASDGNPGGLVTSLVRTTDQLTGDTFAAVVGTPGNPVEYKLTYTAAAGDLGSGKQVVVTATNADGYTGTLALTFNIANKPAVTLPTSATAGGSTAHGTGAQNDPFVVCVGQTLNYSVTAAGDAGDTVTLTESGKPSGMNSTGNPNPGTTNARLDVTFAPAAGQGGQTFAVTYGAKDGTVAAACAATAATVYIRVSATPVITLTPSTTAYNLCVGQKLAFTVRAADNNPGGAVQMLAAVTGLKNATFTSDLPAPAAQVSYDFAYTANAADIGSKTITLTATNNDGCTSTITVLVNVDQVPTLAVGRATGTAPNSGDGSSPNSPLLLCATDTNSKLTFDVTAQVTDAANQVDATRKVTLSATDNGTGLLGIASLTTPLPASQTGAAVNDTFTLLASDASPNTLYSVTFTATSDGSAACASLPVTRYIRVSTPPVITVSGPTTYNVCAGDEVKFTVKASDANNGDVVTLSGSGGLGQFFTPSLPVSGNTAGAGTPSVAQSVFDWKPGSGAPATTTLTFTASDTDSCTAVPVTVTINVTQPPAFVTPSPAAGSTLVVCAGQTLNFNVTAVGNNGPKNLNVSLAHGPTTGLQLGGQPVSDGVVSSGSPTAVLNFSYSPPADAAAAVYHVTFTAAVDGSTGCPVTLAFDIRVSSAPQIQVDPQTTFNVCVGDPVSFRVTATDQNAGGLVTLDQSGAPVGTTFTPQLPVSGNVALGGQPSKAQANFNWTPGANAPASTTVTLTAQNADGCAAVPVTVTINVTQRPTFTGPSPAAGSTLVVCAGQTLSYEVKALGNNAGQNLTLVQAGGPAGLQYQADNSPANDGVVESDGANADVKFTFTPPADAAAGTYHLVYTASLSGGSTCPATLAFDIRVSSRPAITFGNANPAITAVDATHAAVTVVAGKPLTFAVKASDANTGGEVQLSEADTANLAGFFAPLLPVSGNIATGSNPSTAQSVFTRPQTPFSDQDASITFTASNSDGCSNTLTLTIHTGSADGSTASLKSPVDGAYVRGAVPIVGHVHQGEGLLQGWTVFAQQGAGAPIQLATQDVSGADADFSYTWPTDLTNGGDRVYPDGDWTLYVVASSVNDSPHTGTASAAITVHVDNTPPVAAIQELAVPAGLAPLGATPAGNPLSGSLQIAGKVQLPEAGAGARVRVTAALRGTGQTRTVGVSGNGKTVSFTISQLPAGTYDVTASSDVFTFDAPASVTLGTARPRGEKPLLLTAAKVKPLAANRHAPLTLTFTDNIGKLVNANVVVTVTHFNPSVAQGTGTVVHRFTVGDLRLVGQDSGPDVRPAIQVRRLELSRSPRDYRDGEIYLVTVTGLQDQAGNSSTPVTAPFKVVAP